MQLSTALEKATNVNELNDIFNNPVDVKLGFYNDLVSVTGYTGTATSDAIAYKISAWGFLNTPESKHLASSLAEKVFKPLKKLVESPKNYCVPYQIFAFTRLGWTPPPAEEFGSCVALKHAMALSFLDEVAYFTG